MFKRISALIGISALSLITANAAFADEGTGLNIFGGATHYLFGDNDISDTSGGVLGLGYKFSEHWGIEGTYIDLGNTEMDLIGGGDVDFDISGYRADLLYHFSETASGVVPYLAFGAGEFDIDPDLAGVSSDDQTFVNFGGGFKKYITDNLAFRGDLRAIRNTSESSTDLAMMVGLDYFFGSRGKKAAPVAAPLDSDGDGVYDDQDRCPNTPAGVAVDSNGCPLDSDGDGVYDYKDKCPNTPAGARVDEDGCQYVIKETVSVELEVLFDLNKAVVKPAFYEEIKNVGEFMKLFPSTNATIEGHTDSTGDDDYNQGLSERRANAVRQVLIDQHGVDASRIKAVGYGESQPRADNDTKDGRQQNRRVMAVIKTEVEKPAK
ncbi:MAG: OmpA family protein [Pseudomonadales bacterium]|nr:OmpA family protein [Pseudomonadales bacterium]MCP5213889.1 OmpA family protein [Pseudomonadales bacterium]